MREHRRRPSSRRATRVYGILLRLYPRAHQQAFGEQMLQAFSDHYRDAVETDGQPAARYWLGVISDAGKSLLREHVAALTGGMWPMKMLLAAPFGLWRRRQTRGLALVTQLGLIAAVLLICAPLLFGPAVIAASLPGLVTSSPGINTYYLSAAVERPTSQFVAAFTQGTADIGANELHTYHFSTSRVEISTFPLALAGTDATTPEFLLDGEPAARLTDDLRVVEGRLPVPSAGVLEVDVTQATADQLHLALGAPVAIPSIAGAQAPMVRAVGIVQTTGAAFPTNRAAFDPDTADQVRYYAQSNPLDYVLTSDEAIGAYAYDWSQVESVQTFYDRGGPGAHPLPVSENPPLWQAWWVGIAEYARMDAQDLNAVVSHAVPDPTARLNQLLRAPPLAQQTGFVPADTSAGFWQGDNYGDLENEVYFPLLAAWLLAAAVAGALVLRLRPLAHRMAERQRPVIDALRERGAGRRRILGVLAVQVLALAGVALLAGGLLAVLAVRLIASRLVPGLVQQESDVIVDGAVTSVPGIVSGIAATLLLLIAVLVLLRAMRRATVRLPQGGQQEASI